MGGLAPLASLYRLYVPRVCGTVLAPARGVCDGAAARARARTLPVALIGCVLWALLSRDVMNTKVGGDVAGLAHLTKLERL